MDAGLWKVEHAQNKVREYIPSVEDEEMTAYCVSGPKIVVARGPYYKGCQVSEGFRQRPGWLGL